MVKCIRVCFWLEFKGKDTCAIQSEKPVGGIEGIKIDDTEEELFHFPSPFKFIFGDKLPFPLTTSSIETCILSICDGRR